MRVTLLRFTETDEWCVRNTKFLLVLRSLGSGNNQLSRAHLDQLRGRGRSTNCARSLHVCLTPNSSPPGYPFAPGVVELDRPPRLASMWCIPGSGGLAHFHHLLCPPETWGFVGVTSQ